MVSTSSDDRERTVRQLCSKLTFSEKIQLVHGTSDPAEVGIGYVPPVDRLDLPALRFADGPMGVDAHRATAWPASIALAASWNPELAHKQGIALGREAAAKGINVLLAPTLNLIRLPKSGRIFECYSEDPCLTSRTAVQTITGIQSQGVIATAKHFVANNHESNRAVVDIEVSERALRELYLPGFKAAVQEADVGAVMTGYNSVNGAHLCENRRLLTDVLKQEFGFDGFVMSDWWGTKSTIKAATAGLDLEMPGIPLDRLTDIPRPISMLITAIPSRIGTPASTPNPSNVGRFSEPLQQAIREGRIRRRTLDEMVQRIVRQALQTSEVGHSRRDHIDTTEHRKLAQQIAAEGTVLLKNEDNLLPFSATDLDSVAIIGPNADTAKVGGGGSSSVTPFESVSPVEGLKQRLDVPVHYEPGVDRIASSSPFGIPSSSESIHRGSTKTASIENAVAAAQQASVAIIIAQDDATEGSDRETLALPGQQNELIERVAAANDHTIVVLTTSGPVTMPWLKSVPTVLEAWYPGQEAGSAIATVLCGDVDPSGKLPVTFAKETDYPITTLEQYPGTNNVARYSEGVFVGYRHFDAADIEPLFPFGHGESYTEFTYSNLRITQPDKHPTQDRITAKLQVQNTGARAGQEVVQLYVQDTNASVVRPPKELKAFEKIALNPGEQATVSFDIGSEAFSFYDEEESDWVQEPGQVGILIGSSSRDIRLRREILLQ